MGSIISQHIRSNLVKVKSQASKQELRIRVSEQHKQAHKRWHNKREKVRCCNSYRCGRGRKQVGPGSENQFVTINITMRILV